MSLSFLDRERTVASRSYNRWLIPPAALAVHLSIGEVYAFSVFKNPLVDALRLEPHGDRRHLQHRHRDARPVRGRAGHVGRARGAAQGDVHGSRVLVERLRDRGARRRDRAAVARVPRLRLHRRDRARHRLHLPGLDPDQVVPGPSGARDRPGDHGLRRRRADRLAALGEPAQRLRRQAGGRDRPGLPDPGRPLPDHDVAGRLRRPGPRRRLEARGLHAADGRERQVDADDGRRDRGERRSGRRSSGCCGRCCSATSPRASGSSSRPRR